MLYLFANGPQQTTAAFAKVTTGNAVKTMLQIKPITPMRIVEWGYSFDGSAAATPGQVELIEVDVAATVTAYATADITRYDAEALQFGDPTAIYMAITSTNTSGYTATVEGSITTVRNLAGPQLIAPTSELIYQSPLGFRAYCQAAKFTRIRMTFGAAVNAYCYILAEF
jgi:hypothetical protein